MVASRELCLRLWVCHSFIARHHHRHHRNVRSRLAQVTVGIYLRRGLIQGGKRISVEVLLTVFILRMTWSCPVCGTVNQDYRNNAPLGTVGAGLSILVEEGTSAKTEEQDRLKALDASIVNIENARGGKPDVAIDESSDRRSKTRCSPTSRPRPSSGPQLRHGKRWSSSSRGCRRRRHSDELSFSTRQSQKKMQKEEIDLTQLLLLKQKEIADAKNDEAEKARGVETLQAKRLAEVDCSCVRSVSHVSSASCSSQLSPQQWALGLAASLPEDIRVKFEEW